MQNNDEYSPLHFYSDNNVGLRFDDLLTINNTNVMLCQQAGEGARPSWGLMGGGGEGIDFIH